MQLVESVLKEKEPFRYVKVRHLLRNDLPIKETSYSISAYTLPLELAKEQFASYFKRAEKQRSEEDPFAQFNLEKGRSGSFLYLPPKKEASLQGELILVEEALFLSKLFLFISKEAHLTLTLKQTASKALINSFIDIELDEGASLHLVIDAEGVDLSACQLEAIRTRQKRSSQFKLTLLSRGSKTSRFAISSTLLEEGAEADVAGLFRLTDTREAHAFIEMRHEAPHTRSNQLFKHILDGNSHTSFEGKIFVDPIAQKTEAYQLNKNWLLSDGARAESKPNLEIFADDVKASHGATFGKPEKEELFYMRTRGFSEKEALMLLTEGFCKEIVCRL